MGQIGGHFPLKPYGKMLNFHCKRLYHLAKYTKACNKPERIVETAFV